MLFSYQRLLRLTLRAALSSIVSTAFCDDLHTRDFGFQPLEIYKFKNGTRNLLVTDINNDGLDDILFSNNHESRLEILFRKQTDKNRQDIDDLPELEDCFENKGFIVDQTLKNVLIEDVNNDDLKDIITRGPTVGLNIHYQKKNNTFGEPERIFTENPKDIIALQLGDINQDGFVDIAVCRNDQIDLFFNNEDKPFSRNKTLHFSNERCYYFDLVDLNNDTVLDLLLYFSQNRNPLKIRYGLGDGLFDTEQPIELPPRQHIKLLTREMDKPQLGIILRNRLAYRQYCLTEKTLPELDTMQEVSPERIGLVGTQKNSNPPWVKFDINKDGFDDLIIAAPALSQIHIYDGGMNGLKSEPKKIDSLSEISHISRQPDGDLIVISKKEQIAAKHSAAELDLFPEILNIPGHVVAGSAIESADENWFISKGENRSLELVRMQQNEQTVSIYPLAIKNEPKDLLAFTLPDGKIGLIFFMPYSTPKMMIFKNEELHPVTSEAFRALTQQLTIENIHCNLAGSGKRLTVCQDALTRQFEWKDDHYEVVKQFNPEDAQSKLIASCNYTLNDGSTGSIVYDKNAGQLIRYPQRNAKPTTINLTDNNKTTFAVAQLSNPNHDTLILIDRTGINQIIGGGNYIAPTMEAEYVSPSENPMLVYAQKVKLGSPPRPMTALLDRANRSIEIVSTKEGQLQKELVFEIFLVSDFSATSDKRVTEPHDIESGDLNGDQIGDLVLLSQDKLLIYLGE